MPSPSTSVPRGQPQPPRYTLFWPMLIFLLGAGSLATYNVMSLEDQLQQVTSAVDKLDPKVRHADYERDKFYALARDLIRIAPTDPTAEQIVDQVGLRRLEKVQPQRMSLNSPPGFTNDAPADPAAAPGAAPSPEDHAAASNADAPPIPPATK
ncbi:MAG: hypothetical protein WDO13_03655 [Verrucomicrobiota bacterium]